MSISDEKVCEESAKDAFGRRRSPLDISGDDFSIFRMAMEPQVALGGANGKNGEIVNWNSVDTSGLVNRRKKLIEESRSEPSGSTSTESREQNATILRNEIKGDSLLRIMTENQVTNSNRILMLSEKGDLKELMKLIDSGKDSIRWDTCKGLNDYTPLHHACNRGHMVVASAILKAAPTMLHAMTNSDETPLHLAVAGGDMLLVEQLADKGADIDAQTKDGETPLMYACRKAQPAMMRLLLARGARTTVEDRYGDTAVDYCDENQSLITWIEREKNEENDKDGPKIMSNLWPLALLLPTMAFLTVAEIGSCASVHGAWHRACEQEEVWRAKGIKRWQLSLAKSSLERPGAGAVVGSFRPKSK